MTATVNNKNLNATYQQTQANNTKPEINPDNIFVFEDANGNEIYYLSMAEYQADIQDGTIDNTRRADDIDSLCLFKNENEKKEFEEFKWFMADIKMEEEGMTFEEYKTLTAEEIAEYYAEQSASATSLTKNRQDSIKDIDKHKAIVDNNTSKDEKNIDKKDKEIDELKKDIKEQEQEEKKAKEKEIKQAVEKAEKEYDPAKHGDSKEAYIERQVAGLMDSGKTKSAELKDELKILKADVEDLFSGIVNRNKITRQNSFTKLNMNIQNTFSTAATADAENCKAATLSLSA